MSFYQKCPPNTAMIISGFGTADANAPFKIVIGRGCVVLPMIQVVNYLSLEIHKCALDLSSIYTSNGVPVVVKGSLQIKIGSDLVSIATACENFLGKSDTETCQIALDLIEKHLISTASTKPIFPTSRSTASALLTKAQRTVLRNWQNSESTWCHYRSNLLDRLSNIFMIP